MTQPPKPHPRLSLVNRVLTACLLLACIVLAVRLAIFVAHLDQSLVRMSDDLTQVSATAGQISRDVTAIRTEVADLQQKVDDAIPDEKVVEAWRRADSARRDALTAAGDIVTTLAGTNEAGLAIAEWFRSKAKEKHRAQQSVGDSGKAADRLTEAPQR